MDTFDDFLVSLIRAAGSPGLSSTQLIAHESDQWRVYLHQRLIQLFKSGQVYADAVTSTPEGYLPAITAVWATESIPGYVGYDPQAGVYPISTLSLRPLTVVLEATLPVGFQVHTISVSPDAVTFAVGGKDTKILLGSLSTGSVHATISHGIASRTWCLAFSPDGTTLYSGHANGEILAWWANGQPKFEIGNARARVSAMRVIPGGQALLTAHQVGHEAEGFSLFLWDTASPSMPSSFAYHATKRKDVEKRNVYAIEVMHGGAYWVTGGNDQVVRLYSVNGHRVVYTSPRHSGTVTCSARLPMSETVITGDWSGKLHIYDFNSTESVPPRRTIEAHESRIISVAVSPSGRFLASGSRDSQIAIWKMPEGILLERIAAHRGWVRGLAFFDDQHLVSGGADGVCRIWRLDYDGRLPLQPDSDDDGTVDDDE